MTTAWYTNEYSPDEGGYYVEVFTSGGKDLHTTELCDDADMARREAGTWAAANGYRLQLMGNVAR